MSALGAVVWQLRRSLIDHDLLSMQSFSGYAPPDVPQMCDDKAAETMEAAEEQQEEEVKEALVLDGTTLSNLEVFRNSYDRGSKGSLWEYMNRQGQQTAEGMGGGIESLGKGGGLTWWLCCVGGARGWQVPEPLRRAQVPRVDVQASPQHQRHQREAGRGVGADGLAAARGRRHAGRAQEDARPREAARQAPQPRIAASQVGGRSTDAVESLGSVRNAALTPPTRRASVWLVAALSTPTAAPSCTR